MVMNALASVFIILASAQSQAESPARLHEYRVDPGHSIVEFSIGFAFTRVKGRFTQWQGTILYDSIAPEHSSITAVIETNSIDTGWPNRDRHLRTSDFFDVERFPTISFRSDRLHRVGEGWIADGPLTMHGVTRQVSLPFELIPGSPTRSPESRTMILNLHGTLRLARADFAILGGSTHNSWFTRARMATMADSVDIAFEVEAWRADAMTYRSPALDTVLARIVQSGVAPHLQRLRERRNSIAPAEWPNYFRGQDFLVRALLVANRVDRARELARGLTELFPTSADPFLLLGFVSELGGDHRAAAEAFQSCIRKRAEWPEAHLNLGLCYWNMGDREGAGKAFEAVIASEPTSIDALRGLAALAVEREDLDKALDLQAKLIEVGERTPELFYNTGLLLQKSGQFEDAIRLYQEALAEKPDFAEALLNLGHALKAQGKPDEARNCWRQALEQKPELAAGYFEQ